jgi:hypothetical protein
MIYYHYVLIQATSLQPIAWTDIASTSSGDFIREKGDETCKIAEQCGMDPESGMDPARQGVGSDLHAGGNLATTATKQLRIVFLTIDKIVRHEGIG